MALLDFPRLWSSDPWEALDRLHREVDELFARWTGEPAPSPTSGVFPPVNLYETHDGYVLTADIPGVRREDLSVSVENNRVTLRGERQIEYPDDPHTSVHRRERQSGIFRRTVELPLPVDADKAQAIYRHGVLMLNLPKAPEHRPRQISVQAS